MKFTWENHTRRLVGIDRQNIQAASIEELTKEIRPSHALFALCLQVAHTEPQENIHSSMREILHEFSDLFTEPSSLPQTKEIDHDITHRKQPNPLMYGLIGMRIIKRMRLRSRSKICCNPCLCDPALAPSRHPYC